MSLKDVGPDAMCLYMDRREWNSDWLFLMQLTAPSGSGVCETGSGHKDTICAVPPQIASGFAGLVGSREGCRWKRLVFRSWTAEIGQTTYRTTEVVR